MSERKTSNKDLKSEKDDNQPKTERWQRMVVFGDSLSVSPNRFDEDFPPVPDPKRTSHFGQRFSNGWTMVEYLRDSLNIPTSRFHNFATGGETSDDMRLTQFPMFLDYKFDMNLGQSAEDAELYVVFGGSNDFAPFLMKIGTDPWKGVKEFVFGKLSQEMSEMMDGTVERIVHIMENLYGCANARYFFVPNIPNVVSDIPLTKKVFNKYHDKLKKAIKKFQKSYKDTVVVIWDLSAVITDMQSHPNRYGLTQVSLFKNYDKTKTPPEETLFWDGSGHFTTKTHRELAARALSALQKAPPNVEISDRQDPVEQKEWVCSQCSFSNKPRRKRCEMCSRMRASPSESTNLFAAPLPQITVDWTCGVCTYINLPLTVKCAMCNSNPPSSALLQQNASNDSHPKEGVAEVQEAQAAPSSEWACLGCTFINRAGNVRCEMCQTLADPSQFGSVDGDHDPKKDPSNEVVVDELSCQSGTETIED